MRQFFTDDGATSARPLPSAIPVFVGREILAGRRSIRRRQARNIDSGLCPPFQLSGKGGSWEMKKSGCVSSGLARRSDPGAIPGPGVESGLRQPTLPAPQITQRHVACPKAAHTATLRYCVSTGGSTALTANSLHRMPRRSTPAAIPSGPGRIYRRRRNSRSS